MTAWHTGLFSSLERWTSSDQRKQVLCSHDRTLAILFSCLPLYHGCVLAVPGSFLND
jgi:hypothetical protein